MRIKEEKGSVAVVVIVAILFMIALSTTIYFSAVNKKNTGEETTKQIKLAYEKDIGNIDYVYASVISEKNQPNPPELKSNMELVKYDSANNTWVKDETNKNYSYIAGVGNEDNTKSEWANAKVTIDGVDSFFVWIPRYAYKITYYTDDTKTTVSDTNKGYGTIDVVFLKGKTDKYIDKDGNEKTAKRANQGGDPEKEYLVHPAFTNDVENGGWDKELTGIWVGKYETSLVNKETKQNINTSSETEGNILLSEHQDRAIAVQPNVSSWRNITIGNMYTNARNYSPNLESHMLKNSEWGAVAYLTHSQYGRNGNEINQNKNNQYKTGYGTEINDSYNTDGGKKASSTGNEYGIYDLSGGACEYVASYYSGGSTLTNYGNSFANGTNDKYATAYEKYANDEIHAYKKGDATYETKRWNEDRADFFYIDHPFFKRGGGCSNNFDSGICYYANENGGRDGELSFHMCLAIDSNETVEPEGYNLYKGVNRPKLTDGMIPIKYDGTNWVICNEKDENWYNYRDGKNWANVMLSDGKYTTKEEVGAGQEKAAVGKKVSDEELGSMFVWIPRYAYSIKEYKTEKNGEGTTQNITDVTFLVGTTNKDINEKTYATDYKTEDANVGQATPKIVHPAFTFGGEELTGIWVAKFEASMKEDNKNTTTDNNVTNKTIKILPNVNTWRYINVGNAFINCLNMNKENNIYGLTTLADPHLIKNIEWGAISYLTASQYGVTPIFCNSSEQYEENNVKKWHSYSSNKNYRTNTNLSTTGNITGIYDLNGVTWEFVAAYWDNGNNYLSSNGTSEIFPNNVLNNKYTKYWDKYEVSEKEIQIANDITFGNLGQDKNIERKELADERYKLMKNKKGDAMYEIIKDYSYDGKNEDGNHGWGINETFTNTEYGTSYYNNDVILLGGETRPFISREGSWWNNQFAGIFAMYSNADSSDSAFRFSPSYSCGTKLLKINKNYM